MKARFNLWAASFFFTSTLAATPVVTGVFSSDGWTFTYVSGDPLVALQRITIDLTTPDLGFDSVSGFSGSAASTLVSTSPAAGSVTASKVLTLDFSGFLPGMTFTFYGSLRADPPVHAACTDAYTCMFADIQYVAAVALWQARTALASPGDIDGGQVRFVFGAIGQPGSTLTYTFEQAAVGTPEPGTLLLLLSGLVVLAIRVVYRIAVHRRHQRF